MRNDLKASSVDKPEGIRGNRNKETIAVLLILLFAAGADGLMDKFGLGLFLVVGSIVLGAAWALVEVGQHEEEESV